MAYDELDDRDMGLENSEIYEEEALYEPADTFGEQIGESGGLEQDYEAAEEHQGTAASESAIVDESFGETLRNDTSPFSNQTESTDTNEQPSTEYSDLEE